MTNQNPRKSTCVVGCVFSAFALWYLYRGRVTWSIVAGSIGVVLLLIAAFSSRWSGRFHAGWMKLAGALGYVNSRILLSVMYFLVMTPVGALRRMLGHDPLGRRGPGKESYWIARTATRQSREGFERSF